MNTLEYILSVDTLFAELIGRPLDTANELPLVECWEQDGFPIHVVRGAIQECYVKWERGARSSPIQSLRYFEEEVEAKFAEYVESMVGSKAYSDYVNGDRRAFLKERK